MKKKFVALTVFIILCVSCAYSEDPYTYTPDQNTYDPYDTNTTYITPQPRIRYNDTDWASLLTSDTTFNPYIPIRRNENKNLESRLITQLNIQTKVEKYETAINAFHTEDDNNSGSYNPKTLEETISAIATLEEAIAQFKTAGGNPFTFEELEEILYENKNYLLLRKFSVIEKAAQYSAAVDDFFLYGNQETAQTALKRNVELSNSISQFKEFGGDREVFSATEEELAEDHSLLESYVYTEV